MVRTPKYRRRPDRDTAFVEVGGKRLPLPGKVHSPESLTAYHQIVQEILSGRLAKRPIDKPTWEITVAELAAAYLDHAKVYYLKDGSPGGEYHNCRHAFKPLLDLHGGTLVEEFGPIALKEVRHAMVNAKLSRGVINARVKRIQRAFRWGVESEIVPPAVSQAVAAVAGLRKGKTTATEPPEVQPADPVAVEALLPYLTSVLSAMVQVQRLTGMRSDNLCTMRPCDIDRTDEIWLYRPPQHKGNHLDKTLTIPLGPKCQSVLRPFLNCGPEDYIFSPRESELQRRSAQRAKAKAPRPKPHRIRTSLLTHYNPRSYRRALWYARKRANVDRAKQTPPLKPIPHWHPHQLRHTVASEVRAQYRTEAARVYLGHARLSVTEIYAERDLDLARHIAREMG